MTNVSVEKHANESGSSVLRRFTKRVQESGVLNKVRSIRYSGRALSPYKVKKSTLERLRRRTEIEKLAKLGKLPASKKRR